MECNCINKLAELLDEAGVPYTRNPIWGGEQIRIGALCDAVCHGDYICGNGCVTVRAAARKIA